MSARRLNEGELGGNREEEMGFLVLFGTRWENNHKKGGTGSNQDALNENVVEDARRDINGQRRTRRCFKETVGGRQTSVLGRN